MVQTVHKHWHITYRCPEAQETPKENIGQAEQNSPNEKVWAEWIAVTLYIC